MNEKLIKCIDCKKIKPNYKFNSRQYKAGIRYEARCIECKHIRQSLIREVRQAAQYNLTYKELEAMKTASNNKCQICNKQTKLVIDHCHTTGIVRGLLCPSCNSKLGTLEKMMDDNILLNGLTYLERSYTDIKNKINPI